MSSWSILHVDFRHTFVITTGSCITRFVKLPQYCRETDTWQCGSLHNRYKWLKLKSDHSQLQHGVVLVVSY